jgi:hypothetical protein
LELNIINNTAEIISDKVIINSVDDAVNILGNANYLGADSVILKKEHLNPDFFDLKTGIAGDVLQKFSNYQMKLAVIGDFSNIESKSLRDFIYESNKGGRINFLENKEKALDLFSK